MLIFRPNNLTDHRWIAAKVEPLMDLVDGLKTQLDASRTTALVAELTTA